MASFCLHSSAQRPTSNQVAFSRNASAKTRGRFSKAIAGWTHTDAILGPAKALRVDKSVIMAARSNLDELCDLKPPCGAGRLGPMDAHTLAQAAGVVGLVSPDAFLNAALRYRLVRRAPHGILWNAGYTDRNTNAMQHEMARQHHAEVRKARRRDQNADRMRAYRAQLKADALEMRQAEHWPSAAPQVCAFAHISPRKGAQNAHTPRTEPPKLALVPELPPAGDRLGAEKRRTQCAHNAQNASNRPIEALYGNPGDLYSTGQRSDAGLGSTTKMPTAHVGADEPLTLKPGKNLPLGGPSKTQSTNTVVDTERATHQDQKLPTSTHTGQPGKMEPPDDLDEGYFQALEQSCPQSDGLLGGRVKDQALKAHHSQSAMTQVVTPKRSPYAGVDRPAQLGASGTKVRPPRAPWQTAMPTSPPGTHRVVTSSTPPSQIRHTTPSPAVTDHEDDAARAESLNAAAAASRPAEVTPEREAEMSVAKQAIADILAGLR